MVHILSKNKENGKSFNEFFGKIGAFYCCYKACLIYTKVSIIILYFLKNVSI